MPTMKSMNHRVFEAVKGVEARKKPSVITGLQRNYHNFRANFFTEIIEANRQVYYGKFLSLAHRRERCFIILV